MVRPRVLAATPSFMPPHGWLHDRWWSIMAAAHGRLQASSEPVIHYRLSEDQSVGLSRGRQATRGLPRLRLLNGSDLGKVMALHSLKAEAAPELQAEFSWGRLLKTLL